MYAHEQEIKTAFHPIAPGGDEGAYLASDMDLGPHYQPIRREEAELSEGITPRHMPARARSDDARSGLVKLRERWLGTSLATKSEGEA